MINIISQNKIFLNSPVIYPQKQTKMEENQTKMEEFVPLELWMRSVDVTGWPALVGQIVNKIDFETALKCREVSTTF